VRFEKLLPEQFGCSYGELKVAMQYFVQAFGCKKPYPDKYDMLMDIDTEEFSHLKFVGTTIQMLLTGVNCDICFDVLEQNTPLQMKIYGLKKVVRQTAVIHNKTRPNERNSLTFIVSLRL